MNRAAHGEIEPLPRGLPDDLRRPLAVMLDPRPERRPSAAAALGGTNGTQVDHVGHPPPRAGRKRALLVAVVVAVAALVAAGVAWSQRGSKASPAAAAAARAAQRPAVTTPTTAACTPLLYQPCGQAVPAPGTDGTNCLPGRADYDRILANGCEAVSDFQAGQTLATGQAIGANLVPADAVDTFSALVSQSLFNLCLTKFRVTLTAPPGTTDRVEIIDNGRVLAAATSSDLGPGTAIASKPSCLATGAVTVTIRVSPVSGQSAEDFRLTSSGSW
jgi:hypothetical protein